MSRRNGDRVFDKRPEQGCVVAVEMAWFQSRNMQVRRCSHEREERQVEELVMADS